MNAKAINKKQTAMNLKYETAKLIRALLDELRNVTEKAGEDADTAEEECLSLVTEEE